MCDWSFFIGIPDNCTSSSAKIFLYTTSQTLQIDTIIPLKFHRNLNDYHPVQRAFFLRVKGGDCVYI